MTTVALAPEMPGRSRVIAALLSMIAPGVGHLYIGRRRRGLVPLAVYLLAPVLLIGVALKLPATAIAIGLFGLAVIAAVVGVPLFALIDAARLAHRGVGPGARWYVCVLAIVAVWVALVLVGALAAAARPSFPWQSFNIPSASMAPTLRVGDMVLADKTYYATHAPERGDVAMYLLPTDNSTIYVKRIVGLPGDRIAFRDGHVVLNGAVTAEPFADFGDPKAYYNTTSEVVVPPDHLFVAGDNRANSSDSRSKQHGFVPLKNLTDRATVIIYSHDSRRRGLWVGSPI